MADRKLTGVLLAGGESLRFGSPKELAELDGETLYDRARRLLDDACDETLVVGRGGLDDPGTGPVNAIAVALGAATHEIAVVIPVDMPLLTVSALHALAEACADAAVAQDGPLPCALRRSTLPAFERGTRRVRDVLAQLDTRTITLPDELLVNINERDDLQRLE